MNTIKKIKLLMEMNERLPDFMDWAQEMYCEDNITNEFVNRLYEHLTDAFAFSKCLTFQFEQMDDEEED